MAGAQSAIRWLLVASAGVWVTLEVRQSLTRRPGAAKAGWGAEVLFRLIVGVGAVVAGGLSAAAPAARIRPDGSALWLGLTLFWAGVLLRLWSFRTLGRYFTFVIQTSADQPVITDGPYRVIRHPSYAGLLLIMMAMGSFIGNWWSLACLTVAVSCGLVLRIRVEERALMHDLGDDYRTYAATHKRLVPFVW